MKLDIAEKIAKDLSLSEAIWLPSWSIHAVPNELIYYNILRMAPKLQLVRDHFRKPMHIHCWWRPIEYQRFLKSQGYKVATNSPHIQGLAVDFSIPGLDCDEIRLELEKHLHEYEIRLEDQDGPWVHVDCMDPVNGNRFFKP